MPLPSLAVACCPVCGNEDRDLIGVADESVQVVEASRWTKIRTYWERKPALLLLILTVALGSPFLGLVLVGWPGVLVGLAFSLVSLLIGFFAVTRIREIERGGT